MKPALWLAGMLCCATAPAADIVWTNIAGGNWNNGANWSPNQAPGANDTAWITNNGIYSVTLDANAALSGLVLGGTSGTQTLSHASYTLTLNGPGGSSPYGVYALAGGTLTGTGSLALAGPFNWSGGTIGSTGSNIVVRANGGLALSTNYKYLYATVVNSGAGSWSNGTVYCYGTALFSNAAAATFDFKADGTAFYPGNGSPALANAGTLRKTAGTGTTLVGMSCTNTGSVQVNSGTLSFGGGGVATSTGSYAVAFGATLDFSLGTQSFTPGSSVTGGGGFSVSGATLDEWGTHSVTSNVLSGGVWNVNPGGTATLGTLNMSGSSTLGCSNQITVSGLMTWSGGTIIGHGTLSANGGLTISNSTGKYLCATLVNGGAGSWSGIQVYCYGTALFSNAPAATFDFTADGNSFYLWSGGPALANAGSLRKTAGSGTTTVSVSCTNIGSIQVNSGTLSFSGGGVATSTGSYAVASGATLDLSGGTQAFNPGSSVTGAGAFSVSGGTLNECGTHNVATNLVSGGVWDLNCGGPVGLGTLTVSGGTLGCSNAVNVSGPMVWSGGTLSGNNPMSANAGLAIMNGSGAKNLYNTLVNGGAGSWSGVYINCFSTALFSNAPAATFDLTADGYAFMSSGGSPCLANAGTLRKTAGSGTTIINVSCTNAGSIQVNSGTLSFSGGGVATGTGSFAVAAGATLDLSWGSQIFNTGSSVTGAGTFSVSGATLNESGVHSVNSNLLSSGVWNVNPGGTVVLGAFTMSGGTLGCSNVANVSGPMVWSGGIIGGNNTISANGGLTIGPGGETLNATLVNNGAGSWRGNAIGCSGLALFSNAPAATFDLTADGNALYLTGGSPALANAGTMRKTAGTGTTIIGVSCTNTGSILVNSGTLRFDGGGVATGTGSYAVASGATLDLYRGAQTFNTGSSVTGAGTFSVSGATLNGSGTHNVVSNFLSGGVWNVNPGGTATLGALNMSGNGTLGCSNAITVTGPMIWSGGTINGNNTLSADGGLTISNTSGKYLYSTLVNGGTGSWSGSGIGCYGMGLFSNAPAATFDLTADGTVFVTGGGPGLANAGTLRKTAGTGVTAVGVSCTNSGSIQVNSGTLSFSGGGLTTGAGSYAVASGTTLDLSWGSQVFNTGSSVTGTGTFSVSGATLNESGTHNVVSNLLSGGVWNVNPGGTATLGALNMSGNGTLGCSNLITVSGPMVWSGGTINGNNTICANGGLAITAGSTEYLYATIVSGGAGSWSGNPVYCYGTALFSNAPAATFDFTTDGTAFYLSGGSPALANAGTLRKTAGTGTTSVSVSCTNSGSVQANSGTLSFGGSFVQTGGQTLLSGGNLTVQTTAQLRGGTLSGSGTITGSVSNNATVSPGASPGLLTIVGNYSEGPNAHLAIVLGGTTPGSGYDRLSVSGSAALVGTLDLSYWNGFTPSAGNIFTVLVASARSGAFSALTGPTNNLATIYTPTSVLVEPGNVPPAAHLVVNPVPIACRAFQVTASGTDPDGTVTNVTLLLGTNVLLSVAGASAQTTVSYDFPGNVTLTALATDEKGASGATNVVLTIGTLPLGTLDAIGFQADRTFKLCMCGETGANYQILVSDLVNTNDWSVLGTMQNTNGIWRYSDSTATNSARRFYRAQTLP